MIYWGQFAHLYAKLPWQGNTEMTFAVFESSCHLLLTGYYQSNHSKVKAIPLRALFKTFSKSSFLYFLLLSFFVFFPRHTFVGNGQKLSLAMVKNVQIS